MPPVGETSEIALILPDIFSIVNKIAARFYG